MNYAKIDAAILDMDGVLWRGDNPLPAMNDMFAWLQETSLPFALATNNSTKTPADYVTKLARLGVTGVPEAAIITSATATAAYMQGHYAPGTRVFVVGEQGLIDILNEAGFDTGDSDDDPPSVVVAGLDRGLNYAKLRRATLLIRGGADFIGTNPDRTFPNPEGQVPGAGSMLAAIEAATDVTPLVIGKPNAPMFRTALDHLGTPAERTLMIGDRLNTDIEGAKAVGMPSVLLFTGVTTQADLSAADGATWPDVAYEGLPELLQAWAGDAWYRARVKARRGQS